MNEPKTKRRQMRMAGMGLELAAAVTGFALLGIWIDRRYDSEPWGLLVCAAIGVIGGLYNFVRAALAAAAASSESEADSESGG